MTMNVTSRCSRAGAQALRHGTQLAADARDTCRAGALLLRGSPFAVGWFAGWLFTEFPPHVVTGIALSRISKSLFVNIDNSQWIQKKISSNL